MAKLAPEDYYYEGRQMIFTAAYHLKRGYCCTLGCRHCPWQCDPVEARPDHVDQIDRVDDVDRVDIARA